MQNLQQNLRKGTQTGTPFETQHPLKSSNMNSDSNIKSINKKHSKQTSKHDAKTQAQHLRKQAFQVKTVHCVLQHLRKMLKLFEMSSKITNKSRNESNATNKHKNIHSKNTCNYDLKAERSKICPQMGLRKMIF